MVCNKCEKDNGPHAPGDVVRCTCGTVWYGKREFFEIVSEEQAQELEKKDMTDRFCEETGHVRS